MLLFPARICSREKGDAEALRPVEHTGGFFISEASKWLKHYSRCPVLILHSGDKSSATLELYQTFGTLRLLEL